MSIKDKKLYSIWKSMRKHHKQGDINMCHEWHISYNNFINDVGLPPTQTCKLRRLDFSIGFTKDNCTWVEKISRLGHVFGKLTVQKELGKHAGRRQYLCVCICGKPKKVSESSLISGHTTSCGCARKTHGIWYDTKSYRSWARMRQRCNNKNCRDYRWYGAKGIKLCKEWDSYLQFVQDMGEPPTSKHTIDRIDSTKNYCKENCRWVTQLEQVKNCSSNIRLTYNGKTQILSDWAKELNMSEGMIRQRIRKLGWSTEKALTTPKIGDR